MFSPLSHPAWKRATLCLTAAAFWLVGSGTARAQVNILTQHNDIARTGQNVKEGVLTTTNVNVAQFGKLFERPVDSNLWSQPLYASALTIPGKGVRNVVFVETEVGQVYAFDADNAAETAPFWRRDLAPADFSDSLSTPVIDLTNKTLFCVVRHVTSGVVKFTFHSLDLLTGLDKYPAVTIAGGVAGSGKGSVSGFLTMTPETQKQRPALLELNGIVYVALGGGIYEYSPTATWNGWIFGIEGATGVIKSIWAISPDRNGGGIWQAANGLASDGTNIYAVSANGGNNPLSTSTQTGGRDYGNSVVKLTPNAAKTALSVADFWTPWNFQYMEDKDQDLGSAGPLLIPGTNLMMTGDKFGHAYLLNSTNMGHFTAGQNTIVQDIAAWKGHLHGGPIYWNSPNLGPLVYGWAEHDYLKAFKVLGNTGLSADPVMKSLIQVPPGMPGGMLSVSANASKAGTGIIWANAPYIGDANLGIVPGVLRAFDATDLTHELWNSEAFSSRDTVGYYAKFTPPTVANGKVYLSSFYNPNTFTGAKLIVYGLLPAVTKPVAPALAAAANVSQVTLTWNAVAGTTTYNVRRSYPGHAWVMYAPNLRTTTFVDNQVTNGVKYSYVVTAANSGGESPLSNIAAATPYAPATGTVISIDFVGGSGINGTPAQMAPTEVAGAVPAPNWNAAVAASGALYAVRTNGGAPTGASATWVSQAMASTAVTETAGDYRMMKGYLASTDTSDTTVDFANIPANFTSAGYDVYVYADATNPSATRGANFIIGSTSIPITDSQNRDFEGTYFTPGIANVGNYVVFRNLTAASFRLSAKQGTATDARPTAPVNGVQLVAHQSAPPVSTVPTHLVATAHNASVDLTWTGVTNATLYTILRGTVNGGPYTTIGTSSAIFWTDGTAVNNTTYYYVVRATVGGVSSANSNQASATPSASDVGRVISMDFGGGTTTKMGAQELAGHPDVLRKFWNATWYPSGGFGDLLDDLGAKTTTDVTWTAEKVGDTPITDTAGNNRMMRGYINSLASNVTVNIYNLPTTYLTRTYDVYVYVDNYNAGSRTANYAIGATNFSITDAAGVNYAGTYVLGNGGTGNYVKFLGLSSANFTLTSSPVSSTDGVAGTAINGMQIVARNYPCQIVSLAPTTLNTHQGVAQSLASLYRDLDGINDMTVGLRVGTGVSGTPTMDVEYNVVANKLYMRNDQGALVGGFAPGSANVLSNSYGSLSCAATTIARTATDVKVNWSITPKAASAGVRDVYLWVKDTTGYSVGWTKYGTWTIVSPAAPYQGPSGPAQSATVPSNSAN